MICTRCGAEFPDDRMVCPICGAEVQIVPDYNPLDDVLAQEVKGSVEGATRQMSPDNIRRYREDGRTRNMNSTRVLNRDEMDRIREKNSADPQRPRRNTGNVQKPRQDTAELKRQRQQKRLEAAKRKRRNLLITLFVVLAVIVAGIVVAYQNSYTSMINKDTARSRAGITPRRRTILSVRS